MRWGDGRSEAGHAPPSVAAAARVSASRASCLRSRSRLIAARVRAGAKHVGRRAGWLALLQGRQASTLPSAAQSAQRGLAPAFVHSSPIPGGGAWGGAGPRARHAAQRRFVGAPHWSQWAPSCTPISRLLVRTIYAARASAFEMRCRLSSRPSDAEPAFAGAGRHGGFAAAALRAARKGPKSSSSDQSLDSPSDHGREAAQLRQSPYRSPLAQALQMGAGGGAELCVGNAAPGGKPLAKRCLVSQPWHQPPVTVAHQSHGPAPSKPECRRKTSAPPSIAPRRPTRRPSQ